MVFGQTLTKATEIDTAQFAQLREIFSSSLTLIDRLVSRLSSSIKLIWEPKRWLSVVLDSLQEKTYFTIVDKTISLIVLLQQTSDLTPNFSIDDRSTMSKMINRLLLYLRPDYAVYHARAVNLIWSLNAATTRSHVESILAQAMNSSELRNVQESYEAFGRKCDKSSFVEDNMLPGFRFKVPMMIVLDTLKNEEPNLRRIGETWMRCSLKSYLRVLDPILFELMDPSIRRSTSTMKVKGKEIPGFTYERPFDQRYINHLLDMLAFIFLEFPTSARVRGPKQASHTDVHAIACKVVQALTGRNGLHRAVMGDTAIRNAHMVYPLGLKTNTRQIYASSDHTLVSNKDPQSDRVGYIPARAERRPGRPYGVVNI
ncbi:uncharacterized protein C8R40DRAFT_1170491 [Lentinula edodes]|uniref:uncharacterized protein n=1 Tax=Lentinula edodes TaxID=5353 RepID=UPI001E8EE6C0|nr:uncharacterized protein C8R40DRAFT_1170491 [Lentinula edodes]KAH7875406.1 hypothetical protein C8R40DRAFT_1170491 [Lentinula edodes]